MALYKVRWKGKILGEFSKEQIQADLRSSKISLFHQVLAGEDWILTKDFLDNYVEVEPTQENLSEKSINIAYFSTGLAFLSPYLVLISLGFAGFLFKNNSKKNALIVSVIALLMTLLGLVFFNLIETIKG
ncbi:MAG: hypothetical protein R3Y46_03185 [Opitutales bacterium]